MSGANGIIELANTPSMFFTPVLSNDLLIVCSQSNMRIFLGSSNASNYLQVSSNVTYTSKLNTNNLTVSGGILSNQGTFCNIGTFCNVGNTSITGTLNTSGVIYAVDFQASSDLRKKKDIVPITSALNVIEKLQGVQYKFKDGDEKEKIGLIAQEVVKEVPQVVNEDVDGYMSISYAPLVAILIEGIKDLHQKVKDLEEKVEKCNKVES
jgi:hypothetical protein